MNRSAQNICRLIGTVAGLALSACGSRGETLEEASVDPGSEAGPAATPVASLPPSRALFDRGAPPRRDFFVGIDASRSYDHVAYAQQELAQLVARAEPGDQVAVRWIRSQSYANDGVIARGRIPVLPEVVCKNAFDAACRRHRRTLERGAAETKRTIVRRILGLREVGKDKSVTRPNGKRRSRLTDIYGFVTLAAEHFSALPPDVEKHLLIATDLQDNRGRKDRDLDLEGVHVTFFALELDARAKVIKRRKARWKKYLKKAGAASVSFRVAEVLDD
jgi:hypothetical protein